MRGKADGDGQLKSGRIELSVAHVAGSALAAIAAAVLASKLGVYGTILGAGVMSVVATAGGTVFQHLFHRTGEQIKEVRVQAGPRRPAGPAMLRRKGPAREYGEPTTHGTRLRGRRRHVLGALAVFVLAMSVITGIEMFSGGPVSNVWGRAGAEPPSATAWAAPPGRVPPGPARRGPAAPSRTPGASRGGGDPAPSPRTSHGGGAADASTTPTPDSSGSSESGTGSGSESGTGGATAPGTSAPAAPGSSRTASGGAAEDGTDGSGAATPTPGATGRP